MSVATRGAERRRAGGEAMMTAHDDDENARAARAIQGSPFLSPEQAAHYLGLSTRTLQEHRSGGTGPRFRRHCRHVRYHIDDLDTWSKDSAEAGGDA